MMTKRESIDRAKRILRGGYFMGAAGIRQRCPECEAWIEAPHVMGKPQHASLRAELADHLRFEHS